MTGDPYFNNVSLLLHCDGSNGSTAFSDSSSNGFTVAANNDAQISAAQAKFNQSALFDGAGDYLSVADNTAFELSNSDFTIEFSVYFNAIQASTFAAKWSGSGNRSYWFYMLASGQFGFDISTNGSSTSFSYNLGTPSISTGQWYDIALERNGADLNLYVDGVLQSTANISTNTLYNGSLALNIGCFYNGGLLSNPLSGYIDEYRFTLGVARYGGSDYTPATSPFPDSLPTGGENVELIFDQIVSDTGTSLLSLDQIVSNLGFTELDILQTVVSVDSVALVLQQSVSDTGRAHVSMQQTVSEFGNAGLSLDQTVGYPIGDAALSLRQSVSEANQVSLNFSQNVYDPDFVAAGWTGWDIEVLVEGIDINDALTGSVTIEAERSSARIANFTITMSGTINPAQWPGKSVEINYKQNNGATWRRFTGAIERAEYDIFTRTMRCLCTDDLQKSIDGHSREQLDALIGGYWSANVYNDTNNGWDYLRDLLNTVFKSIEFDSNRVLTVADMNNAAAADYSFDESIILDNSLSVELAQRNQLVNKVDITFQARYNRLHHQSYSCFWNFPETICDQAQQPPYYPSKETVRSAIENGGWKFVSANYTPLWPTGTYSCGATPIIYNNLYPDGVRGFSVSTAKRWRQIVTDKFELTVTAQDSIDSSGESSKKVSASANIDPTFSDWGGTDKDYLIVPSGFVFNGGGHWRYDDVDDNEIGAAIDALLNEAVTTIKRSLQQNYVSFRLPLAPYIELGRTISIADPDIVCKGIIHRFTETYDFNTGSPITEIRLAVSSSGSGLDVVDNSVSAPPRPSLVSVENSWLGSSIALETHIGGRGDSEPENENWNGVILNVQNPTPGAPTYDAAINIPFPGIDTEYTDNIDRITSLEYKIAAPDNSLTITA